MPASDGRFQGGTIGEEQVRIFLGQAGDTGPSMFALVAYYALLFGHLYEHIAMPARSSFEKGCRGFRISVVPIPQANVRCDLSAEPLTAGVASPVSSTVISGRRCEARLLAIVWPRSMKRSPCTWAIIKRTVVAWRL